MSSTFWTVTQTLLGGLVVTSQLFFLTLLFALPLGLLVAFAAMNKWTPFRLLLRRDEPSRLRRALGSFRPISALTHVIVWIIRGTPLMLQLIVIFYVPGLVLESNPWGGDPASRMTATVVAFTINYACYFSVIYRGGIEGVPAGQREAGQVLGMTRSQIFFKVTLLQMIKRVAPPMSNEIITLVKDTSLARVISVYELTFTGYSFLKSGLGPWPFFYTGVFYLLFVGVLTILFNYIERRLSYFR